MGKVKLAISYWKTVLGEAWATAWERSDMKGAVVVVLSALIIFVTLTLLSVVGLIPKTYQVLVGDFSAEIRTNLVYLLGAGLVALVVFIFALVYIPAKINNEKEKIINERDKLINPKIDVRLSEFRPNLMMVGVKIENNGNYAIEGCKVDLTDIKPDVQGIGNLPSELHWSNNNQPDENGFLTIPRGQEKSLDIASASDFYAAGEFKLRRGRSPIKFQPGTYSIELSISGKSNSVDVPAQIYSAKIILEMGEDIRIEDIQYVGTK